MTKRRGTKVSCRRLERELWYCDAEMYFARADRLLSQRFELHAEDQRFLSKHCQPNHLVLARIHIPPGKACPFQPPLQKERYLSLPCYVTDNSITRNLPDTSHRKLLVENLACYHAVKGHS